MRHASIAALLTAKAAPLARGPLAIVMAEDEVEIDSTLAHLLKRGFRDVVLLAPEGVEVAPEHEDRVHIVIHDVYAEAALPGAVNAMMDAVAGAWVGLGLPRQQDRAQLATLTDAWRKHDVWPTARRHSLHP